MIATRTAHKFTADEFWQMEGLGFFSRERVEWINGEIITMPAQSNWHSYCVDKAVDELRRVYPGTTHWVRNQATLNLRPLGIPDPDVAVVIGSKSSWGKTRSNPTTALLIVEVSETTQHDDRIRKGSLYAASGIPEYWIVNLVDYVLEVYRDPQPDTAAEFMANYANVVRLDTTQTILPLNMSGTAINIADLFPEVQSGES
jgi:Uma2 family endonuclease